MTRLSKGSITSLQRDAQTDIMMVPLHGEPETSVNSSCEELEAMEDETEQPDNILQEPLRLLHGFLKVMGVGPQNYDEVAGEYKVSWRSAGAMHTLVTAFCMVALTATTIFGLSRYTIVTAPTAPPEDEHTRSMKVIGVVIVAGYQVNALVQVLNTIRAGRCLCRLLNTWNHLGVKEAINPTKGLYTKSCVQVGFMVAFILVMLMVTVAEQPVFLSQVLDGLAERMFLVPRSCLVQATLLAKGGGGAPHIPSIPCPQVTRVVVCTVALHQFAINKGYVFAFTTHCHLLSTGVAIWNTQLASALDEVWGRGCGGELGRLVHRRHLLVGLVRDTQFVFSPVLQFYFSSTVVIVCTELYLLAKNVGSGAYRVEELVILVLLTLQTFWLLVHVSLAAGAVQEQANGSGDVLARGLPHYASDADKFNVGELTRALIIAPAYITGGNFFIINRSFILTVMSVVASYFIVILQFMQSCSTSGNNCVPTNLTLEVST
ncbi:uncharacterized protein [Procambarus clarkii]|uniref:uncharacterized protein n=1 Tax=Procambarus clarkii TaxID=6728 RepID=UPI0037441A4D